jgi:hypothetical protein
MNNIKFKYNCEYCKYYTDYISLWNKHIETEKHIYGKRKQRSDTKDEHKCLKCSFHSKNFTNYRQHYLNYHGTREERERGFKYYCNICDYGTFSDAFYDKHLETYRHQRLERFLFE